MTLPEKRAPEEGVKQRIVVGLSGGVDSSVAAYLLAQQGHDVIGVFMKNWHDESVTLAQECPWWEDSADALLVAQQLDIPFQVVDLSQAYKKHIVDYMFDEYRCGRTPNPDVLCNREIKFSYFLDVALKLGADRIATGHYCRKEAILHHAPKTYRLLAGRDTHKDQSYFLCRLTQSQLSRAVFPLGSLTKPQVRAIAERLHLPTANKKDSQGLCFVGKVRLPDFLRQKLLPKRGKVIAIPPDAPVFRASDSADTTDLTKPYSLHPEQGDMVGYHNGAHYYTVGQRKGLQIGGRSDPLFVIGVDTKNNIVYVGEGRAHPGLYRRGLRVDVGTEHWIRPDRRLRPGASRKYHARIRYRQPLAACRLICTKTALHVVFEKPQRGIASGQFVAWYEGEELIGSGIIQ